MTTLFGSVTGTGGGMNYDPSSFGSPGGLSIANPNVTAALQQYNAEKAALSNPQSVGLLMQHGLTGLANALGIGTAKTAPLQGYAGQSGYPVASVVDGGYGGAGGAGNITQNTQYVQPNINRTDVQNFAQTQFNPAVQEMMQFPDMMSGGQATPEMIAYQMAQQGASGAGPQLAGYAMGAEALPMPGAPSMSQGETRQAGPGDMGAAPPQAPQQPVQQGQMPQQAPPGTLPPSAATAALQGAPPPEAVPPEYAGPIDYDPSAKAPGMKGYRAPQAGPNQGATPGSIGPAGPQPQQPPRPGSPRMNPLDAMLLMMSPKAAKAVMENNKARAAAQAAIEMKKFDFELDMKKAEYVADRTEQLEIKKKELEAKAAKHLNAAQLATVMDKFMDDVPGGAKRTALADQFPELLPYLNDPQSREASMKFRTEALTQAGKALEVKKDTITLDAQIDKIVADANKAGYDTQDAFLKTQFDKDTYNDRVAQEANQNTKQKQDIDQASIKNPLEIQKMAMDHIMDIQKYGMNESSEARAAQGSALAYMKQLTNMVVMISDEKNPIRQAAEAALIQMSNAFNPTPGAVDKKGKPIPPKGDFTLAGALTNNAVSTTLSGGRKANGLVPPPPASMPSLSPNAGSPYELAGVVNQAGIQFSKNGLAQAPQGVPMPPGSNPGLQQVQRAAFQNAQPTVAPRPQGPAQPTGAPNLAQQGAPLSTVQQSIKAGKWLGSEPPTTAERLQLMPHLLSNAISQGIGGGLKEVPAKIGKAMDQASKTAWEREKKQILNPFITPESRGFKKGSPLVDPELVSFFARKAQTNERFADIVKAAGWTPVVNMDELRSATKSTPILKKTQVLQAYNSGLGELLSPAQREWASLENREAGRQNFVNRYSGSEPGNRPPQRTGLFRVANR